MLPAGGLRRGQPLQPRSLRARLVGHPGARRLRGQDHGERGAQHGIGLGQRPGGGVEAAVGGPALDGGDRQIARVEHERIRLLLQAVEREHRGTAQAALVEADLQVELDVGDPHLVAVGVGMEVAPRGIVGRSVRRRRPGITSRHDARQQEPQESAPQKTVRAQTTLDQESAPRGIGRAQTTPSERESSSHRIRRRLPAVRGGTLHGAESGEAPARQCATRKHIGHIRPRSDSRSPRGMHRRSKAAGPFATGSSTGQGRPRPRRPGTHAGRGPRPPALHATRASAGWCGAARDPRPRDPDRSRCAPPHRSWR